jgi:hypothetical protein
LQIIANIICTAMGPGTGQCPAYSYYAGPGDVVSGALAWWGFEAYSNATRGAAAVNVCNVSDVACADMFTDATTGKLVVTTVGGSDCSVVTCTVKSFYDLSGNGRTQTQATIGSRAVLTASALNGVACATFNGAKTYSTPTITQALPITYSVVAERTGAFTLTGAILSSTGSGANELAIAFSSVANQMFAYNGSVLSATANDSVFHAVQGILPTAGNGTIYIDGSLTIGAAGTGATAAGAFYIGSDPAVNRMTGLFCEGGVYRIAFSAGQLSSMNTNQHSSGRWNF